MPDFDNSSPIQVADALPSSEAANRPKRQVLSDDQCNALLEEAFGPITDYRLLLDDPIPY